MGTQGSDDQAARWARQAPVPPGAPGPSHGPGRHRLRQRRRRRRLRRRAGWVVAGTLVAAGGVLVGQVGLFGWRYHVTGHALVTREHAVIAAAHSSHGACQPATSGTSGAVTVVDGWGVHGELEAPAIGLDAPVVEGTGDAALAVAVGHDPSSTWPAPSGTTVLVGHDVTWFSQVGRLVPGDTLDYVTPCTTYRYQVADHRVVQSGTPLSSGSPGRLDLVTCFPLNALYLTSRRYVVEADLVSVIDTGAVPAPPPTYPVPTVPAPPALAAEGLGLSANPTPLGSLALAGSPSIAWQQSATPLEVHTALLELYFGALRSAEQNQPAWWAALAPTVPLADAGALVGATPSGNAAPIQATLEVTGATVTGATLTAAPTVTGPAHPTWRVTMTATVVGGSFTITAFSVAPA